MDGLFSDGGTFITFQLQSSLCQIDAALHQNLVCCWYQSTLWINRHQSTLHLPLLGPKFGHSSLWLFVAVALAVLVAILPTEQVHSFPLGIVVHASIYSQQVTLVTLSWLFLGFQFTHLCSLSGSKDQVLQNFPLVIERLCFRRNLTLFLTIWHYMFHSMIDLTKCYIV